MTESELQLWMIANNGPGYRGVDDPPNPPVINAQRKATGWALIADANEQEYTDTLAAVEELPSEQGICVRSDDAPDKLVVYGAGPNDNADTVWDAVGDGRRGGGR